MGNISGFAGNFLPSVSKTIPISQTESDALVTGGLTLCGIQLPATFTGTAISFEMCDTIGGTYVPMYNSAGAISYTVAASRYIAVDPKDFQGVQFLKIKSNATELAARTLLCALKGI